MKQKEKASIILASTSPRRVDLLAQARIPVTCYAPDADESRQRGESPKAMVARLAHDKAASVITPCLQRHGSVIIISADTIVVAPDKRTVLGKPKNEKDAARMLRALSGKTHTVFTGYCIIGARQNKKIDRTIRVVESKVKIRKLSQADILQYIHTGEPMDKAGSYAAQGLGMVLIESIQGSYTNVVGLPMAQLLMDLEQKFGVTSFPEMQDTDA